MNKKDKALKMAIKEIEKWINHVYGSTPKECKDNEAIKACKEALKSKKKKKKKVTYDQYGPGFTGGYIF